MKNRITKTLLTSIIAISLLSGIMAFTKAPKGTPKTWEIELMLETGNTNDYAVQVTALKNGQQIVKEYDLAKDMVPQGPVVIEVNNKDDLDKVLVTRDDAINEIMQVKVTEMTAATAQKVKEKVFTMPAFEQKLLIIWND